MTPLLICWTFVLCLCLPSVLAAGGTVTVKCTGDCVESKWKITKKDQTPPPFFLMDDNKFNHLTHDIRVNKDTCIKDFTYEARGTKVVNNTWKSNEETKIENNWKWDEKAKNIEDIIPVTFGKENTPSNCHEIQIKLFVRGKTCDNEEIKKQILRGTVNPLKEWIEAKERKEKYSFPNITFETDRTPILSWEEITSNFACDFESMRTKGSIDYTAQRKDSNDKKTTKHVVGTSFKGMFETQKYPNLTKEEQCYTWNILINVEIKFYLSSSETSNLRSTFERLTEKVLPGNPNLKVMKKNNESIINTYLKIEENDKPELRCLENKANIELRSTDKSHGRDETIPIEYDSPKTARINLEIIPDEKCVESQALIKIFDLEHKTIAKKLIMTHPELLCTKSENTIKLNISNEQFQGCDLTYRIICRTWNSSSPNNEEYKDQKETEFTIDNLQDKQCSVIAFMKEPNDVDQWFYIRPPIPCYELGPKVAGPKVEEPLGVGVIVASVMISVLVAFGAAFVYQKSRSKKRAARKQVKRTTIKEVEEFPHFRFKINEDILENLETFTSIQQDEIKQEHESITKYTDKKITPGKTTNVSQTETNRKLNRYVDIVPYDSNKVTLSIMTGKPPSTYINASPINFPGCSQEFLAVQAPRPNMFSSFWQMVDDKNVNIIVIITSLQEDNKVKAHQYWPNKDKKLVQLKNGIKLQYISQTTQENYDHSSLIMENNQGQKREIELVQCSSWHDVSALEDTKILLDLLYKTMELVETRPGPILVHCSAGVGRTGTFIGLYKLVHDYKNKAAKEIDFFETVVTMREQRMMMVQKPMQYYYMIKCYTHHVSANEIDYQLIGIPSEESEQEDDKDETPQTSEPSNRSGGGVAVSGNLSAGGDIIVEGGDSYTENYNTANYNIVNINVPKGTDPEVFAQYLKATRSTSTNKGAAVTHQNYPALL